MNGSQVSFEITIVTGPATVFALLTASNRMSDLARAGRNGMPHPVEFSCFGPNGCWVEVTYVELKPDQLVAFTWGGTRV
jgi:uncharacterized protein YndB with AHSA1/START domain